MNRDLELEKFKKGFIGLLFSFNLFLDAATVCVGFMVLFLCSSYGFDMDKIVQAVSMMNEETISKIALLIFVPSFLLIYALRLMFPKFKLTEVITERHVDFHEHKQLQDEVKHLHIMNEYSKQFHYAAYNVCDILENEANRNKLTADEINSLIEQLRVFSKYPYNDYSSELSKLSLEEQVIKLSEFIETIQAYHKKIFDGVTFSERNTVNMYEKLKEVDVRKHKVITGEIGTGKTSRIRELIDILELNNESTLVIDVKPLNIWTDMEKEVKFKTANFSDDISLDNFTTVIIDEAMNLNEHLTLKNAVLENFRNDKNIFILSFQKENDSVDFFKKN